MNNLCYNHHVIKSCEGFSLFKSFSFSLVHYLYAIYVRTCMYKIKHTMITVVEDVSVVEYLFSLKVNKTKLIKHQCSPQAVSAYWAGRCIGQYMYGYTCMYATHTYIHNTYVHTYIHICDHACINQPLNWCRSRIPRMRGNKYPTLLPLYPYIINYTLYCPNWFNQKDQYIQSRTAPSDWFMLIQSHIKKEGTAKIYAHAEQLVIFSGKN